MPDWSPARYLQFEEERTRPSRDLVARVEIKPTGNIIDMGCGPGNSTALLAERFPGARIVGLDSSPAMLAEARRRLPGVAFAEADADSWTPDPGTNLVFANAIYQWVPEHLSALQRVLSALAPGAVLAVQMPDNLAEPSHRLMRETAAHGPWAERLAGAAPASLPPVRSYHDALAPLAVRLDIWHTTYHHVLPGPSAIVDWVRSTGLRRFLAPLDEADQAAFLAIYAERIARAYPPLRDGRVILDFPRLFILARR